MADDTVNIVVQCRAILALRSLGSKYLDLATLEHWNSLLNKFNEVCETNPDSLYLEDILTVGYLSFLSCYEYKLVHTLFLCPGCCGRCSALENEVSRK